MSHRALFRIAAPVTLAFASVALYAQFPAEPTAYTVTVRFDITGTAFQTTYRLGTKVLVDALSPAGTPPGRTPATHTRTLYFLDIGQSLSWDLASTASACTRSSFHRDAWNDPFSGLADIAVPGVVQAGSETIHGIETKILISKAKPGMRLWVDPKTGLMLKADFTPPLSDKAITYFEVTDMHMESPPATMFEIPAHCAKTAK